MVQNCQKVKPFLFLGAIFQSQFSWELYVQWNLNEAKDAL